MDAAAILRDMAKAKAAFQLRAIEAIITERPMNETPLLNGVEKTNLAAR